MTSKQPGASVGGFDIGSLDTQQASEQAARIELKHPTTKKGLGVFFYVIGRDSFTYREYLREQIDEQIEKNLSAQRRGVDIEPKRAREQEAEAIENLCVLTTNWEYELRDERLRPINDAGEVLKPGEAPVVVAGKVKFFDRELDFNIGNVREVFNRLLWVRRQIDEASQNLENFIPS